MVTTIRVPSDKNPARRMARLACSAARGKITELEQALEAAEFFTAEHAGVDMSRFPASGHLASRADRAPLDHQSGAREGRAKTNAQVALGSTQLTVLHFQPGMLLQVGGDLAGMMDAVVVADHDNHRGAARQNRLAGQPGGYLLI